MPHSTSDTVTLNDGRTMPAFGLGVYQARSGGETHGAVLHALRSGYRHIDTAEIYRNEEDCGAAIADFLAEAAGAVRREDLWITTKFFPRSGSGRAAVHEALRESLRKLRLAYVDLYLIHSPMTRELRLEQWAACGEAQAQGLAKSIGVSNYGVHHLEELRTAGGAAARVTPAVNQVELNPYITRGGLVAHCKACGIVVEAYSPLTKGERLADPKLLAVAARYGLTAAQLMVRWCLQRGYVVIPKSVTASRIEENAKLGEVDLSEADMAELDGFDEYLVTGWDPTVAP